VNARCEFQLPRVPVGVIKNMILSKILHGLRIKYSTGKIQFAIQS